MFFKNKKIQELEVINQEQLNNISELKEKLKKYDTLSNLDNEVDRLTDLRNNQTIELERIQSDIDNLTVAKQKLERKRFKVIPHNSENQYYVYGDSLEICDDMIQISDGNYTILGIFPLKTLVFESNE